MTLQPFQYIFEARHLSSAAVTVSSNMPLMTRVVQERVEEVPVLIGGVNIVFGTLQAIIYGIQYR